MDRLCQAGDVVTSARFINGARQPDGRVQVGAYGSRPLNGHDRHRTSRPYVVTTVDAIGANGARVEARAQDGHEVIVFEQMTDSLISIPPDTIQQT